MVNARSMLRALALAAPLVAAAPPATVTSTKTVTKTVKATSYSTITYTKTMTDVAYSITTDTKTITEKTTATAPVSTLTLPPSTVTVVSTSTQTLPASTSTVTQTLPASTSTVTQTMPANTITVSGSCTSAAPSATGTNPTTTQTAQQYNPTQGLNDLAKANGGRYIGTAVDIPGAEQDDPVYMAVANDTHLWGSRTPANTMKYEFTEPEQGVFDYSGGDYFIQMAHEAGINHIRCHNLVWYSQLPNWLTSGTWTNESLIEVMTNHITNLITYWGDNCSHWDVVNEAFNDDGTYRSDVWFNTIGWEYLPIAFSAAQAAVQANDLSTKLYYNDYNIETPGAKSNSAALLVKNLTSMGIQIDGVGLQSHFIVNSTSYYPTLEQGIAVFTNLGVEVALTELDVRVSNMPPNSGDERSQFNDYKWPTIACFNNPLCVGITVWDFDDTYSWVPSTFPGAGYADLFILNTQTNQLVPKIAYDGVVGGITGSNSY